MMRRKMTVLLGCMVAIFLFNAALAQADEQRAVPVPMAALHNIDSLDFCGEPVPLHEPDIRERLEKELLLSVWDRPQVILWLKRYPRCCERTNCFLTIPISPSPSAAPW